MDTTTTAKQLQPVLSKLADVLDGITAEQAGDPTPCTEYDVAALRSHVVGWATAFADGFADPQGRCSDPEAVTVTGTGGDQVRAAAASLAKSLPEAADRPMSIGEAQMPGELSLGMILWEYQVHGWDLARATGQEFSPAQDGLENSLEFAPMMLTPDYQGEGKSFAPRVEVPQDAPALDRLVGLSGRDPKWSATDAG